MHQQGVDSDFLQTKGTRVIQHHLKEYLLKSANNNV